MGVAVEPGVEAATLYHFVVPLGWSLAEQSSSASALRLAERQPRSRKVRRTATGRRPGWRKVAVDVTFSGWSSRSILRPAGESPSQKVARPGLEK